MRVLSTKIFAHRGASKIAPENTMAAFEMAYEQGAEGIETDVHLTKDHIPVLIHDEHLKRTTNGRGYIKDYTFSELATVDAGSWFSSKFSKEKIISLDEFLNWSKDKSLHLNIELKNNKIDYEHLEAIVYEMISDYQLQDRTILSTFNTKSVQRMKDFKDIEVALLTSKGQKDMTRYAKDLGANALHIKYRLLKSTLMKQAKRENMPVRMYTINKEAHMLRCFSYGCDGIFTDVPDLALKQRRMYEANNI